MISPGHTREEKSALMALGRLRGFQPTALRSLRVKCGLSVDELAIDCGASSGTIRSWEAGRFVPSAAAAKRLADALGVRVYHLTNVALAEATLTDLRQWQGWTGEEAAEHAGLGKSQVYLAERYVSEPTEPVRRALADAYGVSPSEFDGAWHRGRISRYGARRGQR